MLYPEDGDDIINWLAHRVQRPGQKIKPRLGARRWPRNRQGHVLQPVKLAVGPWNFQEISPTNLMDAYNPFVKAVVLRMNEAHDLGESERANRYALYERVKIYAASAARRAALRRQVHSPALRAECARADHHHQSQNGWRLSAERRPPASGGLVELHQGRIQRRLFQRDLALAAQEGGNEHVAAYLAQRDLSAFDPCGLPRQTAAFFDIVNASQAPEDAELADVLDDIGNEQERAGVCSLAGRSSTSPHGATLEWLLDRRHRRSIPYRMERCGYIACRNPNANDGLWRINGRRQTLYAKADLTPEQQLQAARDYVLRTETTAGNS